MSYGVTVRSYRGDSGVFKSQIFKDHIKRRKQLLSLSGVGTHGQNGVVERAIQTVVNSERTMMLHQALLWPEHFDMRLWSFTMTHAAYLWNNIPQSHGMSPMELYSGKNWMSAS